MGESRLKVLKCSKYFRKQIEDRIMVAYKIDNDRRYLYKIRLEF